MDYTDLTALEVEVLRAIDERRKRMTVAELVGALQLPAGTIKSTLAQLRRAVLVSELPPHRGAPALYGTTVFGSAELRRRHDLKAVA